MKAAKRIAAAAGLAFALGAALTLTGCDGKDGAGGSGGAQGQAPRPEVKSCLASDPGLRAASFPDAAAVAQAFAKASAACGATAAEVRAEAKEMEQNGIRIENQGDSQ